MEMAKNFAIFKHSSQKWRNYSYCNRSRWFRGVVINAMILSPGPKEGLEKYWLTSSSYPSAGGLVTGEGRYTEGSQVSLTATPNEGFVFSGWSGDAIGSTQSIELFFGQKHCGNGHFFFYG